MGNEDIIAKAGRAFDKARRRLTPTFVEALLLKPTSDATRDYEVLWHISRYWFFDTEKNVLLVADFGLNLETPMTEATNVQIGEQYFEIKPDDVLPPDTLGGTRAYWSIGCDKFTKRANYAAL